MLDGGVEWLMRSDARSVAVCCVNVEPHALHTANLRTIAVAEDLP